MKTKGRPCPILEDLKIHGIKGQMGLGEEASHYVAELSVNDFLDAPSFLDSTKQSFPSTSLLRVSHLQKGADPSTCEGSP